MTIFEMSPFSKEYITNYLIKNKITSKGDAETYYSLFDGNMQTIMSFKESALSLKGFIFNLDFFI